jgi:hypothetical protein
MIGDFVGHELVRLDHGLRDETHHDPVDGSRIVNVGRIVQLLVKEDRDGKLFEILGASGRIKIDQICSRKVFRTLGGALICYSYFLGFNFIMVKIV